MLVANIQGAFLDSRAICSGLPGIIVMPQFETEALILRTYNLAEADKIVVCLTRSAGLIRGVAKGCRKLKNRFGASNEVGVFEMTGQGLVVVLNPSELFLQERPEGASGSVVTACMEGTRPVLVEIQALVSGSKYGTGKRMAHGLDQNRLALLIAMLEKRFGYHLIGDDVFVNVAGGLEVDEPAVDLGIVAAIVSSFRNVAIDPGTVVCGEAGLAGEVRGVMQAAARAREAQALGFSRLVLPESNKAGLEKMLGLRVIGVRTVEELVAELF